MPKDKPSIVLVSHTPDHGDGSIRMGDTVTFATSPSDYDNNPVTVYGARDDEILVSWSMISSQRTTTLGTSQRYDENPGPLVATAHLYGSKGHNIVSLAETSFDVLP